MSCELERLGMKCLRLGSRNSDELPFGIALSKGIILVGEVFVEYRLSPKIKRP